MLYSDGIRLCKAQRFRYKHLDLEDLKAQLVAAKGCRNKLIVTDGVFSMDGDIAPLKEVRKYNSRSLLFRCDLTVV